MDENNARATAIDFRRLFLWTQLFRAFRIALDIRKAMLAAVALLAISTGNDLILKLPFAVDYPLPQAEAVWPAQDAEPLAEPPDRNPLAALATIAKNGRLIFKPLMTFAEPAHVLLNPRTTFPHGVTAWTLLAWTMLVWGLFGGAITRMAAVEFARDERHGMRTALFFAFRKILSFLGAPLLPIGGMLFFWLLGLLAGLLARIPGAGEMVVGAGFIVPLVFGLVMALILLAVSVGWPLMSPAISAEGSDGFDGFSRTFSYVFGRPWHYLWYGTVALAYGFVVVCFVLLIGMLLVYLTGFALAAGMGIEDVTLLMNATPTLLGGPEMFTPLRDLSSAALEKGGESIGSQLAGLWMQILSMLVAGFAYSYFWTASTIIYFLLRRVDDATALDEVYLAAADEEDDLLPLVGVAASDQPVVERPANVEGMENDRPNVDAADDPHG